jgi:hypothetical protein
MWLKHDTERELRSLLAQIVAARRIDPDLASSVVHRACPRLAILRQRSAELDRLIKAEAWVEMGLWLIGWELPDWGLHHLSRDDARWCCSIGVSGMAVNWIEDIVEFDHDNLPLAVLGAFVEAQLRKVEGPTISNITPFRRPKSTLAQVQPSCPPQRD